MADITIDETTIIAQAVKAIVDRHDFQVEVADAIRRRVRQAVNEALAAGVQAQIDAAVVDAINAAAPALAEKVDAMVAKDSARLRQRLLHRLGE